MARQIRFGAGGGVKFIKKPVVIEAEQWFPGCEMDGVSEVELRTHASFHLLTEPKLYEEIGPPRRVGQIKTLEGIMYAELGDWVITGVKGEKYPCKPDIFEATYERAE